MKVNELSVLFQSTSPKMKCKVIEKRDFEIIYKNRIEFLNHCENPLEELEIIELYFDTDDNTLEIYIRS